MYQTMKEQGKIKTEQETYEEVEFFGCVAWVIVLILIMLYFSFGFSIFDFI